MAKTERYELRMSSEEMAQWKAAAEDAGYPLSEWMRAALNDAALGEREGASAGDSLNPSRSRSAARAKSTSSQKGSAGGAPPKGPSAASQRESLVGRVGRKK